MGYFLGHRIPDNFQADWEDDKYKDMPDVWKWYHLGYEEGLQEGEDNYRLDRDSSIKQENEALKALIAANYRGMKEEIKKELATDTNTN